MTSPLYSLENPPNAPKKAPTPPWRTWALVGIPPFPNLSTEEEEEKAALKEEKEWATAETEREFLERSAIRPKLLAWTPREVKMIDNPQTLNFLHKKFAFPHSQPRNVDEQIFYQMMVEAVVDRMTALHFPPCE